MKFLFPGFLFALITVVIPVIIHLFNFRRVKKVWFSNVSLLKEIEQRSSSRRKVRRLLLLAARILTLIFLVFAFARPYIPSADTAAGQQRIISVYIDNSYSMEMPGVEGALLEEAKRKAKEIAASYDINDRFALITNDFEGRHQRLFDRDDLLAATDAIKISGISRTVQQIVTRQQEILSAYPGSENIFYLISDFQNNMVKDRLQLPDADIRFRLVRLSANAMPNISVDSVWFVSPLHRAGGREQLVIQLRNNSDKEAENVPVRLSVNNQQRGVASFRIAPRAVKRDTLSFGSLGPGWQQAGVSITDYPLTFDDRLLFTFLVRDFMPVQIIHSGQPNRYLQAVYKAEPFFRVKETMAGSIDYSSMSAYPLIIVNGLSGMSEGFAGQLKNYAVNGGTLMIFPDISDDLSGLALLTGVLGTDRPEALAEKENRVANLNLQHPVFRGIFEKIPQNVNLPVALKYVVYGRASKLTGSSLMEFSGRRSFISQYAVGKGTVYLSAVALDEGSGNLVRHSLFVPLMYQAAFLSLHDKPLWYTTGKDNLIQTDKIVVPRGQLLKLQREDFEIIPDVRQTEAGTDLYIADQVRDPGYYRLQKADSLLALIAFNDKREESDLSYASEGQLMKLFPEQSTRVYSTDAGPLKNLVKAQPDSIQLWKLCLILALIFLAAEIAILRYEI